MIPDIYSKQLKIIFQNYAKANLPCLKISRDYFADVYDLQMYLKSCSFKSLYLVGTSFCTTLSTIKSLNIEHIHAYENRKRFKKLTSNLIDSFNYNIALKDNFEGIKEADCVVISADWIASGGYNLISDKLIQSIENVFLLEDNFLMQYQRIENYLFNWNLYFSWKKLVTGHKHMGIKSSISEFNNRTIHIDQY